MALPLELADAGWSFRTTPRRAVSATPWAMRTEMRAAHRVDLVGHRLGVGDRGHRGAEAERGAAGVNGLTERHGGSLNEWIMSDENLLSAEAGFALVKELGGAVMMAAPDDDDDVAAIRVPIEQERELRPDREQHAPAPERCRHLRAEVAPPTTRS